jgi:hypothetical protein
MLSVLVFMWPSSSFKTEDRSLQNVTKTVFHWTPPRGSNFFFPTVSNNARWTREIMMWERQVRFVLYGTEIVYANGYWKIKQIC